MCENQSVKGFLVITPCNICWLANVAHLIIKKSLNWWSTKGKLSFSYRQNRTRINLNILMIKVSDFSGMNIFSTSFAIFFSFPRIIVSKATPELSGLTLNGVGSGPPLDSGLKPWKHSTEVLISFSVQFSCSVVFDSLQPHELQHTRPPCPSPTPEFTQTHVHQVSDAIQPSHPLSSPSPPAFNPSQHQGLFKWVSSLHEVVKVLEFQLQHQSFQWIPRTDLL